MKTKIRHCALTHRSGRLQFQFCCPLVRSLLCTVDFSIGRPINKKVIKVILDHSLLKSSFFSCFCFFSAGLFVSSVDGRVCGSLHARPATRKHDGALDLRELVLDVPQGSAVLLRRKVSGPILSAPSPRRSCPYVSRKVHSKEMGSLPTMEIR